MSVPRSRPPIQAGDATAALAAARKLPESLLRGLGVTDLPGGGVGIPYFDDAGTELYVKSRGRPGGPRFGVPKGTALVPYGLWKLADWNKLGILFLCEGESDCWPLWHAGFPALGLPGASSSRCLEAEHLSGVTAVVVVPDNDRAGEQMAAAVGKRLAEIGFAGTLRRLRLPDGFKDVSELHQADPDGFPKAFARLTVKASPVEGAVRAPAPNCPPSTTRPTVVIGTDEHRVVAEVTRALAADDGLYQRDGVVVRVVETGEPEPDGVGRSSGLRVRHPEGAHGLRPASPAYIRLRTTVAVRLVKSVETEAGATERDCHPPSWLAPAIVEAPGPIRPVRGVLLGPSVDAAGRLIAAAGYDAPTRLYLTRPVPDLAIPDRPSREDARAAALLLCDLVGQFPWQGRPDLSRWLSLLLTACGRHLIGTVPLGLITATTAGSGKTLLASVISAIAHGLPAPILMSWPEGSELQCRGDEVRKRLASLLHESATLVLIDNLPRGEAFGGPEIDAFLTADAYHDRQLGKNDGSRVGGPNRCLLLATGNAVRPDGDTADRTLVVSLVPDDPNPRARPAEDFAHPDLIDHILRERRRYLGAALAVWRGWILADCPRPAGPSWGSFMGWVDTVASAVRWLDLAELPDPIGDRVRIASEMDGEGQALRTLMGLWPAVLGTQLLTAGEIIRRLDGETPTADQQAMREALAALGAGWRWPPTGIRLGKTLTSYLLRVVDVDGDPVRLISDPDSHRKVHRYACERMPAGNAVSAGSLTPLPRARGDESEDVHVF